MKNFLKNYRAEILFSLILLIPAVIFALLYVRGEDNAYIWDYRWYWEQYYRYGEIFRRSVALWAGKIGELVGASEYNPFYTVLLLPVYLLFGPSRFAYISGLTALFLVPCVLAAAFSASSVFGSLGLGVSRKLRLGFAVFGLLFFPFWAPVLRGLPDICGSIPLALALALVFSSGWGEKLDFKRMILLGVLLYLPFLFRKWHAFAVIGFYAAAFTVSLAGGWGNKKSTPVIPLLNCLGAGIVTLLLVFGFQKELASQALHAGYAASFSHFKIPWLENLGFCWRYFGPWTLGISALGLVFCFFTPGAWRLGVFVLLASFVDLGLEARIEAVPFHHLLPIALWLFVLSCFFLARLEALVKNRGTKIFLAAFILLGQAAVFGSVFYPFPAWCSGLSPLLNREKFYRIRIAQRREYGRLAAALTALLDKGGEATVFASSQVMTGELLLCLFGPQLQGKLVECSHYPNHLIPLDALRCRYAVTTDPVQLNLPSRQQVVSVPARALLEGRGWGGAYRRLPGVYALDSGAKAFIFEKKRPFNQAQVEEIFDTFCRIYPDWREIYRNTPAKAYLGAVLRPGKAGGLSRLVEPRVILLQSGILGPTSLSLDLNGGDLHFSELELYSLPGSTPEANRAGSAVSITVETAEGEFPVFSGLLMPGAEPQRLKLGTTRGARLRFTVGNNGKSTLDRVLVKFIGD